MIVSKFTELAAKELTWIDDIRIFRGGDPLPLLENSLKESGAASRTIGIEEELWFSHFILLRKLVPNANIKIAKEVFARLACKSLKYALK